MREIKKKLPPLSVRDRRIYWVVSGLCLIGMVSVVFYAIALSAKMAFRDPAVAAYERSFAQLFLYLPPMVLLCIGIKISTDGLNRNIPAARSFPLRRVALWCAGFLLTLGLLGVSLSSGDYLMEDSCIVRRGLLGKTTEYTREDYTRLDYNISPYRYGQKSLDMKWSYDMRIVLQDGSVVTFPYASFAGDNEAALETMLELKDRFPRRIIELNGQDHVPECVEDCGLNARETKLLYELFEVNPNG